MQILRRKKKIPTLEFNNADSLVHNLQDKNISLWEPDKHLLSVSDRH